MTNKSTNPHAQKLLVCIGEISDSIVTAKEAILDLDQGDDSEAFEQQRDNMALISALDACLEMYARLNTAKN